MKNKQRFSDLIPYVLRSVAYVHQSHTCKAYCALEQLYAIKPHFPDQVWHHCSLMIKDDEPKVDGLIIPELLELDEILDATSGRNFGPDWILGRGLMPLSYWAMRKKIRELGFEEIVKVYANKALEQPRYLGHEISILSAHWHFYRTIVIHLSTKEDQDLYFQRFAEYITATYANGELDLIEHPKLEVMHSDDELLWNALRNPGFFGHHVLAFVWGTRLKPWLDNSQQRQLTHTLSVLNNGYSQEEAPNVLEPIDVDWSVEELDAQVIKLFLEGPKNIHQITLVEALLWCWTHYPNYRRLIVANLVCFTDRVRP